MTKKILSLIFWCVSIGLHAQEFIPGWTGNKIIADTSFLKASLWTTNQSDLQAGDECRVTSDDVLNLHWRFGAGNRPKFAQAYLIMANPLDLSGKDVFGLDIRGQSGKRWVRNIELKFESATGHQSVYTWEDLAHLNRWGEKLVILKKQFSNYQTMDWNSAKIISFAVTMNSNDNTDIEADSGTVSFRNLVAQSIDSFSRAGAFEALNDIPEEQLQTIRGNAIQALANRQKSTGLLTTWAQDGSSWLYGQGLALKALCEEGQWNGGVAENSYAESATGLAHFLATHQEVQGYWPRAWNSLSGNILVKLEGDNTVWMGDFPWIPGSLAYYYRKSGDETVYPSIIKARSLLYDLIDASGKVNTKNMVTGQKSEVNNYEGYAATMYGLLEMGDTVTAKRVMDYVMEHGWDNSLRTWNEGPGSSRPVLLVNVWLAALAREMGYDAESIDALSLAAKLLYTRGPGDPYGLDGIGPIATWFEGTLSYIASNGPASNALFAGISDHINTDGMVPAYNENLGAIGGIWAVDWHSLDATSWLYFASAKKNPFTYSNAGPDIFTGTDPVKAEDQITDLYVIGDKLHILTVNAAFKGSGRLSIYNVCGQLAGSCDWYPGQSDIELNKITGSKSLTPGIYIVVLQSNENTIVRKIQF